MLAHAEEKQRNPKGVLLKKKKSLAGIFKDISKAGLGGRELLNVATQFRSSVSLFIVPVSECTQASR